MEERRHYHGYRGNVLGDGRGRWYYSGGYLAWDGWSRNLDDSFAWTLCRGVSGHVIFYWCLGFRSALQRIRLLVRVIDRGRSDTPATSPNPSMLRGQKTQRTIPSGPSYGNERRDDTDDDDRALSPTNTHTHATGAESRNERTIIGQHVHTHTAGQNRTSCFWNSAKNRKPPAGKPSDKKTLHAQYKMLTTQQMQLRKEHMIVSMSNKFYMAYI